jgi:1-deoxy-D-xylulose-5-phosphate synthase
MALDRIRTPADLRELSYAEIDSLADEIRDFIVDAVSETGGHLGSNLGVVELTLALHRVFQSPTDAILWDTGHQAYVHKIVTGRQAQFEQLRQGGGLSGYPSREESEHDYVENSHASTILSYAYGMAIARDAGTNPHRHIVAVIGDGSMTGGMAYEALNNIGHGKKRVIIILNDNGRSYAPTVSNLSASTQGHDEQSAHPSQQRHRQAQPRVDRHSPQPGVRPAPTTYRELPAEPAACRQPGRSRHGCLQGGGP